MVARVIYAECNYKYAKFRAAELTSLPLFVHTGHVSLF
jgi:hypothetical protein